MVDAIASLIDQDSSFVFAALDGKSSQKENGEVEKMTSEINYRDEPVAFFFILFGIAFEALMTRPGSDLQESRDQTLEILLALKKILRPSVCGHAIYQDVVFSETMEVLDRLALTEGMAIRSVIVEITRNLCLCHPSVEKEFDDQDNISDDIEQLFELTRIIVLILTGLLPNLNESPSSNRSLISDESIPLIMLCLNSLVDVVDAFPSVIRTDLRACIFHIFTTILGTGPCQVIVVPKALPIFKRFVNSVMGDLGEHPEVVGQIRSCLYRFRAILVQAQRRESDASLSCAKNTLLASVIVLTTASDGIPCDEPAVRKLLDDLLDCLRDLGLGKVAANCIRSLLLSEMKNDTGRTIAKYLFPRLMYFTTDLSQEDPEDAADPILQSLVSYVTSLTGEQSATAINLLVPTLLRRAQSEKEDRYPIAAGRLLALANANPVAFRDTVGNVETKQKTLMEGIIRTVGRPRGNGQRGGEGRGEPTISLKMTFGR